MQGGMLSSSLFDLTGNRALVAGGTGDLLPVDGGWMAR